MHHTLDTSIKCDQFIDALNSVAIQVQVKQARPAYPKKALFGMLEVEPLITAAGGEDY